MPGRNTVPIITLPEPAISHPREPVDSSCLSHVGYHEPLNYLYCTFHSSGMTYIFPGVPFAEYEALMNADSIGKYFTKNIKPRYPAIDVSNRDA
jgi:hypothetical protein